MSGSPFGILELWSNREATDAQSEAAAQATQLQRSAMKQQREDLAPWQTAGEKSLNALAGLPGYNRYLEYNPSLTPLEEKRRNLLYEHEHAGHLPPPIEEVMATPGLIEQGPGEFTESPGYQFTLGEGMKGIQRAASATGRLGSGASMKNAARYAEGLASTEYDNFLNRWYKSLDPYFTLAGMGQTTAGQLGQGALSTGNQLANLNLASGQAQAAGYLGQGNILSNQFSSAGNNIGQYFMNRFGGGQQGGGGGGWGGYGAGGGYYGTQGAYYQPGEYASYNFL